MGEVVAQLMTVLDASGRRRRIVGRGGSPADGGEGRADQGARRGARGSSLAGFAVTMQCLCRNARSPQPSMSLNPRRRPLPQPNSPSPGLSTPPNPPPLPRLQRSVRSPQRSTRSCAWRGRGWWGRRRRGICRGGRGGSGESGWRGFGGGRGSKACQCEFHGLFATRKGTCSSSEEVAPK